MFLWISGFLKGNDEDDSLKYDLTVPPQHETAVMRILGWDSFDESADGEWLLTSEQAQQITRVLGEQLPVGLDLFIGVRE